MKNILCLAVLSLAFSNMVAAQSYEGTTKYDKKTQRAILIDYGFPPEAVQNAFIAKMAKLGYKAKEEKGLFNRDKGFIVFASAYVTDISNEAMDYIIYVEQKSKKEGDQSTLYMIMAKGDQNAMEKMDVLTIASAKSFLNNLVPDIETANLELQIKDQEEKLAKAEKKLRDLKDDQANLEKKLEVNRRDQVDSEKDVEGQKQALDILRAKRLATAN